MSFADVERATGVRMTWNIWPHNKQAMADAIVPISCTYSPLAPVEGLAYSQFEPLKCSKCNTYLNPYCAVDLHNKNWVCNIDGSVNPFPPHYAQVISETTKPPELTSRVVEVWYPPAQGQAEPPAPIFLFVVDLATPADELEALKTQLQRVVVMLPPGARVGLVSFGTMVYVHELGFASCPRAIVFRGSKEVAPDQVLQQLGIPARSDPRGASLGLSTGAMRFLVRADECEDAITAAIGALKSDAWEVPKGHRATRCTGNAMLIAQAIMEGCATGVPGRTLLFSSGPCTIGPGQVADPLRKEVMRAHYDLQQESKACRFVKKAIQTYADLAQRVVRAGHAVDLIAASLDQCGLYEMKVMADRTGGAIVMTDSFTQHVFDKSLTKLFAADETTGSLSMAFRARLEIVTSKDVQIAGIVGGCASIGKAGANVSSAVRIGEASTCEWALGAVDRMTALQVFFTLNNEAKTAPSDQATVQFRLHYTAANGQRRLRVVTVAQPFADPDNLRSALVSGFDQEAAIACMAKYAAFKSEGSEAPDVLRWLDRSLIRMVSFFSDFEKDQPDSLVLPQQFLYYPKFLYHLRRSRFLQTFGASPDETAFHRGVLCRENVANAVVMIQPTLVSYSVPQPMPTPVNLDVQSMRPDVLLLLDTFFEVVTWKGADVVQWIDGGWLDQPGYESLKDLIEMPNNDAAALIDSRCPAPRFISAFASGSQERFLMALVNPSVTNQQPGAPGGSAAVLTDDVSFEKFFAYLKKLAVASNK